MSRKKNMLAVCLVMLVIFMGCRSSKVSSTKLEVDTTRHTVAVKDIQVDSMIWDCLKVNNRVEWVQERYAPVHDSTGQITGSVLAERWVAASSSEEQWESGTAIRKQESDSVTSSVSGKTRLAEDLKVEKKPAWSMPAWLYLLVVVLFSILIYFRNRK